jgi:hypothetical protein
VPATTSAHRGTPDTHRSGPSLGAATLATRVQTRANPRGDDVLRAFTLAARKSFGKPSRIAFDIPSRKAISPLKRRQNLFEIATQRADARRVRLPREDCMVARPRGAHSPPYRNRVRAQQPTGFGQEESFVVAAIWTLVRPLRSVNGPSTTDDVHPVIGHSRHPRPGKYFGREWPLSRKSNVPWVSENCRVELLLRLSDSVAPPYRVHSAGPIAGNGQCQSIQSYESLWCAHAQILGRVGSITSTTWFDAESTSLRSFLLLRRSIFWKFVWS